jgi:2,3,4,5-tetrahydropyridine-2-carboxylate N-succinyltransferase
MNSSQAASGVGAYQDPAGQDPAGQTPLPASIDQLWDRRDELGPGDAEARAVVTTAVDALDAGEARVARPDPAGGVSVDERAKRAILLAFRLLPMEP